MEPFESLKKSFFSFIQSFIQKKDKVLCKSSDNQLSSATRISIRLFSYMLVDCKKVFFKNLMKCRWLDSQSFQ